MSIPEKDLKILWGKAAGRCSMLKCRKVLVYEASEEVPSKNILLGQNCHIVAEKENGPRGKSVLTLAERNRYPNLILLCVNHHTQIDQDTTAWPVEKLHQIKSDHEIWVETQLTANSEDIATELYSDLVNTITEALLIPYWDWVSDHAVRLLLSEEFVYGVKFFWEKSQKTIWPQKYTDLETAIKNLCERAGKYIDHFLANAKLRHNEKEPGKGFFVEDKWWKIEWRNDYDIYAEKSNKWQKQTTSLLFNVVLALNEYADSVRKFLNPKYLIFQGKFVVNDSMGVLSEMRPSIFTPIEYIDIQKED